MLQKLLLASLMCISLSMQAGHLSRIAEKVGRPLQKAIVVLVCSTTTCLMGFKAEAELRVLEGIGVDSYYGTRLKELSLGGGSHSGHGFVDGKVILADNGRNEDSVGYLRELVTLDEDGVHLQELNAYLYYDYYLGGGKTYGEADKQMLTSTRLGFDHYDMRSFELADDTDGFVVSHLHLIGVEFPLSIHRYKPVFISKSKVTPKFSSKVGAGGLGLVKTGIFSQADLEAWAGDEADFSYSFFLTNSIGVYIRPMQDGIDVGRLGLGFKVEQMRTLRGDIDFTDGTDGSFTAIWESAQAEVEITLLDYNDSDDIWKLGVDLTFFRQLLDAESDAGKHFLQRKNGRRIRFALSKYWE